MKIPAPPLTIASGARVTIKSTYPQNPTKQIDAMGIVLCYVVRN